MITQGYVPHHTVGLMLMLINWRGRDLDIYNVYIVKGQYELTARKCAAAQFTGTWILLGKSSLSIWRTYWRTGRQKAVMKQSHHGKENSDRNWTRLMMIPIVSPE